jgi:RNA polymerase sigma-54 factor
VVPGISFGFNGSSQRFEVINSMIGLQQTLKLGLKLTPQQVQYLKLLQLPTLVLEQRIKTELELNPMLELGEEVELSTEQEQREEKESEETVDESYSLDDYIKDELAGYKSPEAKNYSEDDESYEPPMASSVPLAERLLTQLKLQAVDDEEIVLAEEILGNVDEYGYLRRSAEEILQDLQLSFGLTIGIEKAERLIGKIQLLEPPGIASRSLQECLIAQLKVGNVSHTIKGLAMRMLEEFFEDFKHKRFEALAQKLAIGNETLKKVFDLIHQLNPKPGEGEFTAEENYITPDFIVEKDNGEFVITLNDRNIPSLRLNAAYKEMVAPKGKKKPDAATKEFVKQKFESAKWFIASIVQRRETLLKVMRAIVARQRQWFDDGETLKPMIYRDIGGVVGVDISTISRVCNSKYVQTEFGVYSLKSFFSPGLESSSGEDISNVVVKRKIKDIIGSESSTEPLNDDVIALQLQKEGIKIARRTIAKYREQLGMPVARLRKKI